MKVLSVNLVQEFKKIFLTFVSININCYVSYVVLAFYLRNFVIFSDISKRKQVVRSCTVFSSLEIIQQIQEPEVHEDQLE